MFKWACEWGRHTHTYTHITQIYNVDEYEYISEYNMVMRAAFFGCSLPIIDTHIVERWAATEQSIGNAEGVNVLVRRKHKWLVDVWRLLFEQPTRRWTTERSIYSYRPTHNIYSKPCIYGCAVIIIVQLAVVWSVLMGFIITWPRKLWWCLDTIHFGLYEIWNIFGLWFKTRSKCSNQFRKVLAITQTYFLMFYSILKHQSPIEKNYFYFLFNFFCDGNPKKKFWATQNFSFFYLTHALL